MIYVSTYCETAKKLREELKDFKGKNVLVRLGGGKEIDNVDVEINTIDATKNCINKLKSKQILIKNDIPTLPLIDEIKQYPVVIKGVFRSCGSGVFVVDNKAELPVYQKILRNNYYVEPLFHATSEYRLHCTKERCFFSVKKIKNEGFENDIIVNSKNHYNIREFMKPRLWKQMLIAGIEAMKATGLDIGAIDFGYSSVGDHSFVIHEINTGPELFVNTREAYKNEIERLIQSKLNKNV